MEEKLEKALETLSLLTKQAEESLPSQNQTKQPQLQEEPISKEKAQETGDGTDHLPTGGPVEPTLTQLNINKMIEKSINAAIVASQGPKIIKRGIPYPAEYEKVPYPKGFQSPNFRLFTGIGNPKQHVARYRAQCCNAGGSDALLLKQFVTSLSGVAFDWYSELPNHSVATFDEMEELFIKRFAIAQQRVTIADLIREEKRPTETIIEYIIRWRNLCMQCQPQIDEENLVGLLLKNIQGPTHMLLLGFDISTFQELLNKVAKLMPAIKEASSQNAEKASIHKLHSKQKKKIHHFKKEKEILMAEPKYKEAKPNGLSLKEKLNKRYSFSKEYTGKILKLMIKAGFQLREPKKPQEAHLVEDPNYCMFHRCVGHTIEDCIVFKDLVEKKYQLGEITLSRKFLIPEASIHMISIAPACHEKASEPEESWKAAPSKEAEEILPRSPVCALSHTEQIQQSAFERERTKYQKIIRQNLEEIMLLEAQSKKAGEFIHELLDANSSLKREVKTLRKELELMTVQAAAKKTERKEKGKATDSAKAARTQTSLKERLGKIYPFKREGVKPLFDTMLGDGLLLPDPKKIKEADMTSSPDYCPYHRCIGHVIEDCFVFKDLLEKKYHEKAIQIPRKYLIFSKSNTESQPVQEPLKGLPAGEYSEKSDSSDDKHIKGLLNISKSSALLERVSSGKFKIYDEKASSSRESPQHTASKRNSKKYLS